MAPRLFRSLTGSGRHTPVRLSNPNTLCGAGAWVSPLARGRSRRDGSKSMTAAGFRVTHQDTDTLRRLVMPWQSRAFAYYDIVPEIKYAAQFYSRMLSPLRLYAAEKNAAGEWVESKNEVAIAALDRIQDPGGGTEGLLSSYGRLMFLIGEALLLWSLDPETQQEQWEMLSVDELRIQSGVYIRYKAPSLNAEEYREVADEDVGEPLDDPTRAVVYRLWKKHPRYSMWPDSSMQGVLDLCEELVLLTQAVRARARSRLAGSGILFIDERISQAPPEPVPDEDPVEDPWLNRLTQAMMAPIVDEGTASAIVPLISRVNVPPEMKLSDMVYHLQLVDPTQLYPETGLRLECIHRIAIGLDMPPEELEGKSDANHWTVWMIDEQTWKAHGQPVANQFVNDLTGSYYRPQLAADGIPNPENFAIRYDPSGVVNHPDRGKDALSLFNVGELSGPALRDALGFDESDAPSEVERWRFLGIKTHDGSLALFGKPKLTTGGVEDASGVIETGAPGEVTTGPTQANEVEPGPPTKGAPAEPPDESVVGAANGHSVALARVLAAADLALLRAREVAGNRLISLAKRNPEMRDLVRDVPTRSVAVVLGPDRVRSLKVTEQELVKTASDMILDAFRLWHINPDVAILVGEQIELHAVRTLYEERPIPLPNTFSGYVLGLLQQKA